MRDLTEAEKKRFWEEVQKEFPDDDTMQQVHYVRLLHRYQTESLSSAELIRFFQGSNERVST